MIVKALDGKSTRINGIPAPNLGTIPRLKESQKLEDRDLEVLRLMSIGLIDTVAARSLAISLRTYRRRVAEIMKKLNVDSRFQAGVVVGQRGWLP
ncbi:MAG: LuxR C-terminal-related transcriptional regulator [Actinomycetota bacterium]|nr:LuxR C-terminal-related transcriptional regulator [Actinomycetota bacterium]